MRVLGGDQTSLFGPHRADERELDGPFLENKAKEEKPESVSSEEWKVVTPKNSQTSADA